MRNVYNCLKSVSYTHLLPTAGCEKSTCFLEKFIFLFQTPDFLSLIHISNLTLDDLRNPEDTAHSRIYDRLLSMCVPVRFTGDNFRQETAQRKMESMKKLITD